MIYLIPALISITLGFLILNTALKGRLPGRLSSLFLSASLGLGTSGFLTFTSFILFNQLIPWFVILLNLALIGGLVFYNYRQGHNNILHHFTAWDPQDTGAIIVLGLITLGMVIFASLYPYGGWDAWGSWNFKARFLFLGGNEWTRMFDPILWRHQILYPFLLPLINVWFWSFGQTPTWVVPMAMTRLIPVLTAGLLYSTLKDMSKKWYVALVPLWIFTNMFTIQLSASQYSDPRLSLFLLTAIVLFLLFQKTRESGYLALMGLTLGMMSFSKVVGAALCILTLAAALLLIRSRAALALVATTLLAAMPLIIFLLFYSPKNGHIFTNGLTSPDNPSSFDRLATIISYYGKEFISMKWTGLWIALAAGLVLSGKKCLRRELWIFPIVLGAYLVVFTGMYFINTFYAITWWLDTSLNRIIFTLIPACALWVFLALNE